MDYGRLAYIKAEELEKAIVRTGAESASRRVRSAAFYPDVLLTGEYAPTAVTGRGEAALVVSVWVRAPQGADNAKVWLTSGGMPITYGRVTLGVGERTGTVLTAALCVTGESLGVRADGAELILEEMHVLISGEDVAFSVGGSAIVCDGADGRIYTARADGDGVRVQRYGTSEQATVRGTAFDLSVLPSGVHVLVSGEDGLVGVVFTPSLGEKSRVALGDGGESVAIGRDADGAVLAVVRDGKVLTARCDEQFANATDFAPLDGGIRADGVFFSKQSDASVLFVQRGGKIYAKVPLASFGVRGGVVAEISFAA